MVDVKYGFIHLHNLHAVSFKKSKISKKLKANPPTSLCNYTKYLLEDDGNEG